LYVGKKPLKFNIPEAEAVDRLVDLIREHGRWVDPIGASAGSAGSAGIRRATAGADTNQVQKSRI
jgi:hypothetical protein